MTLSPDTIQTSQKLWMEQLETMAQGFANVMGTDAALRALNLPSRSQMDRLFERLVSIEERLDDIETDTRLIRRALRHTPDAATSES